MNTLTDTVSTGTKRDTLAIPQQSAQVKQQVRPQVYPNMTLKPLSEIKEKYAQKEETLYGGNEPASVFKPPVKKPPRQLTYTTETFKGGNDSEAPVEIKLNDEDKAKYFNATPQQLSQLRFTNVSLFSTTPYDQAEYTTKLLTRYFDESEFPKLIITDGNSCIGGNTQSFAQVFGKVNAIELNSIHMECLQNNMSVLGHKNIEYHEGNIMDFIDSLKAHVLFLDPPWGGVDYKTKAVSLYYTDSNGKQHTMNDIINGKAGLLNKIIMLKAPKNFDIETVKKETLFKYVEAIPIIVNKRYVSYIIYIFSHILPKTNHHDKQSFNSLNYKNIRFTKI